MNAPLQQLHRLPKLHLKSGGKVTKMMQSMGVTQIMGHQVWVKCDVEKFKEAFKEYDFDGKIKYYGLILNFIE